jgi:hypothetical protein
LPEGYTRQMKKLPMAKAGPITAAKEIIVLY